MTSTEVQKTSWLVAAGVAAGLAGGCDMFPQTAKNCYNDGFVCGEEADATLTVEEDAHIIGGSSGGYIECIEMSTTVDATKSGVMKLLVETAYGPKYMKAGPIEEEVTVCMSEEGRSDCEAEYEELDALTFHYCTNTSVDFAQFAWEIPVVAVTVDERTGDCDGYIMFETPVIDYWTGEQVVDPNTGEPVVELRDTHWIPQAIH